MIPSPIVKTALLFVIIFGVVISSIAFAVLHMTDLDNRIDFKLSDQTGNIITQKKLENKYLAVFFGFTNCSHICPTGLAKLTHVMYNLEEEGLSNRVTPVFVSVDPERDTREVINQYLQYFHEAFIGLRGSKSEIETITEQFKTIFRKQTANDFGEYDVAHSSVIYIIDPFSRLVGYISNETDIEEAENQLKEFIL